MNKVAITGLGIITPSGIDKRKFWANIKAGRSAVETITRFDASKYDSRNTPFAGGTPNDDRRPHTQI